MTLEEHQAEVEKLNELESVLLQWMIDKKDSGLLDVFYQWKKQRDVCNEGFIKVTESILNQKQPLSNGTKN